MSENWLPIVAGILIILVAVAIARLAPESVWGQELRRSYGVKASGPRGYFTRRDHLRGAALAAVIATVLEITSYGAARIWDGLAEESPATAIAFTYTFGAFLLASMAALSMIRSLWKAAVWRVELPDTPAHRRGLADAIDNLLDGKVTAQQRAEFLDVRYVHPQLEQIRRATMKLVAQHKSEVPDAFRSQIKEWTAGIRESTGDRAKWSS